MLKVIKKSANLAEKKVNPIKQVKSTQSVVETLRKPSMVLPAISESTSDAKKEVVTTFSIMSTDGLQLVKRQADMIQAKCSDTTLRGVNSDNLKISYDIHNKGFRAEYMQNSDKVSQLFSDFSFGQLCAKLGIPVKYLTACVQHRYNDLALDNLNTWISGFGKDLMLRLYDDTIRGVMSSRYSIFDTPDIIDVVDDTTRGMGLRVKSYFINEERFHARLIQQEQMNINGEDLFAGIQIDSSDVGRSTLTVNFFIFKQICTNGLCISKGKANLFAQKHIGICSDDFKEELKNSLTLLPELIKEYEYIIKRSALQYNISGEKNLKGTPDTNTMLADFIKKLKETTKLSDEGVNKVIELSRERYGFSDWGIVNSITEVAQDYTLERRIELEKVAGAMLKVV